MELMDVIFFCIYVIGYPTFYVLLKASGEDITIINVFTVLILSLLVFSYIGLLPLYCYWDEYRYAIGITDRVIIFKLLLCSFWAIASILIVRLLFSPFFKKTRLLAVSNSRYINKHQNIILFCVFILSFIFFVQYIGQLSSIAIFSIFDGDLAMARSKMGNDFKSGYHWFKLFLYDLSAFLVYVFFACYLRYRTRFNLLIFLVTLSYAMFISVMAAEKAPLAFLMTGLFMVYIYTVKQGKVSIKNIFLLSFTIISILSVLYMVFMGAGSFGKGVAGVFSRSLTGGIMPAYFYLEYYPEYHDFSYGQTLPNPKGIFDYVPYRYTVDVANWVFPWISEKGLVGSMPTVFWGEAYVNFGFYGVVILPILVGIAVVILHLLLSKLVLTPIAIAYVVWAILFVKDLAVSGFGGYLLNVYFPVISVLFLLAYQKSGRIKYKK